MHGQSSHPRLHAGALSNQGATSPVVAFNQLTAAFSCGLPSYHMWSSSMQAELVHALVQGLQGPSSYQKLLGGLRSNSPCRRSGMPAPK